MLYVFEIIHCSGILYVEAHFIYCFSEFLCTNAVFCYAARNNKFGKCNLHLQLHPRFFLYISQIRRIFTNPKFCLSELQQAELSQQPSGVKFEKAVSPQTYSP